MERLTKYVSSRGEYAIDCKCETCDTCKENILALCSMQDKVIQKCGEYENTGLTPQEVEKLKKENTELKAKLTPKEPKWIYEDEPMCPCCSEILGEAEDYNACSHCGQVIDWRNW